MISMKLLHVIFGASLLSLGTFAHAGTLCQQKEQNVQNEIDIAKKHDNKHRVIGLQQALNEIRANCNDDFLRKAHQEKISQHEKKVSERERELQQEKAKGGNGNKIKKREKKLDEARNELKEVQATPY